MAEANGWHPEDIKAEVRKKGTTLTQLALDNGLGESLCRLALITRYSPRGEKAIAKFLGLNPYVLWPQRYDRNGHRIIGHSVVKSRQNIGPCQCQKRKMA